MKLAQALALILNISRRRATEMIKTEEIKLNGEIVDGFSVQVDAKKDILEINGKQQNLRALKERKVYYAFYKPTGVECTLKPDSNLHEYLNQISGSNLKPVGRLDQASEGLLLITNDGDFINKMLHPKNKIDKEYYVRATGFVNEKQIEELKEELTLSRINIKGSVLTCSVVLQEGRNRQIRRAFTQIGMHVEVLRRMKIGKYKLEDLKPGKWRELSL
ncbi:MAG TPA: pseudouridine synthase [Vampirovibrionales bacterium]